MWSKIYLGVLAIAVVVTAFFTYYSWSWLQSIGAPANAVTGYEYHTGLAWTGTWIFTVLLLLVGNAILWTKGSSWALWTTLIYFSVFVLIRSFWLDQSYFAFKTAGGLADGSLSFSPIIAVILVVLIAVIVFFDTFLVTRLRAKTYAPAEPAVTSEPETPAE